MTRPYRGRRGEPLMPDNRRLAVRLIVAGYATAAELASLLGVSRQAVYEWAERADADAGGGANYRVARERRLTLVWERASAAGLGAKGSTYEHLAPWLNDLRGDDWRADLPPAKPVDKYDYAGRYGGTWYSNEHTRWNKVRGGDPETDAEMAEREAFFRKDDLPPPIRQASAAPPVNYLELITGRPQSPEQTENLDVDAIIAAEIARHDKERDES